MSEQGRMEKALIQHLGPESEWASRGIVRRAFDAARQQDAIQQQLLAALEEAVDECRECDGHTVVMRMLPSGASSEDCRTCEGWRAAIAAAKGDA